MEFNPYKVLSLSKDASLEDIKKRYKKLARKYHPDKGGDPQLFVYIDTAYKILSNNELRYEYDTKYLDEKDIKVSTFEELKELSKSSIEINTEKLSDKEVIVDKPIADNDWERIWKKFCTERKLKDLVNIFPKGFDQSIFNQIFNDMKKSTDVTIYKEPEISFCQSTLHSQDIITQDNHVMNQLNGLWRDTYQIQLNPNMVNKYKSDESILRDDNITDEDRKLWERNMNSYRNGPL